MKIHNLNPKLPHICPSNEVVECYLYGMGAVCNELYMTEDGKNYYCKDGPLDICIMDEERKCTIKLS